MRVKINYPTLLVLVASLSLALILAACGSATPSASPTVESAPAGQTTGETGALATSTPPGVSGEGYPAPDLAEAPSSANPYPGEGEAGLPPTAVPEAYPPVEEAFQEPRFRIDQPVSAGATQITGQAPPDTAIAVMDVTFNGELLGTGRSDSDGRFAISVSGLTAGNRIGLSIGELEPGQTIDQMADFYFPYRGEGFINLPNVGIFFDTTIVNP